MRESVIWFGTDPEFAIFDHRAKCFVPAHSVGLQPKKRAWAEPGGRGKAFRDGYMLEVNVQPTLCRQTLAYELSNTLAYVKRRLGSRYVLRALPAITIELQTMRDAPPDVRQFGCEPSFCGYDEIAKVPPIDALTHRWRYAGGHMHFSTERNQRAYKWLGNPKQHPAIARVLDWKLGLPLSFLAHSALQYRRRAYYGQAGEFRTQHYQRDSDFYTPDIGFEYRTPGPEVWTTPWLSSWAFGVGRWVVQNFPKLNKEYPERGHDKIRGLINTGKGDWAEWLGTVPGFYTPVVLKFLKKRLTRTRLGLVDFFDGAGGRLYDEIQDGFGDWWCCVADEYFKTNPLNIIPND